MASVTITIPDALVPRVVDALYDKYPKLPGETNGQYAQRIIGILLRREVIAIEENVALKDVDGPTRRGRITQRHTDLSGIG